LSLLVDHTKKTGKNYPRPQVECDECNGVLIACYGDIKGGYWRHKPINGVEITDHEPRPESYLHKTAKELLTKRLTDNPKALEFVHTCKTCHVTRSLKCPDSAVSFRTEKGNYYASLSCVLDVAAYDRYGNVVFGLCATSFVLTTHGSRLH
jgi:hypothetical protein